MSIKCHKVQLVYTAGLFDGNYRTSVTSEEYWFGLYKRPRLSSWGYSTRTYWYDGNNSTYTDWVTDEPNDGSTACVRYTKSGFRDFTCSKEFRYTCKKAASKFYAEYPRF